MSDWEMPRCLACNTPVAVQGLLCDACAHIEDPMSRQCLACLQPSDSDLYCDGCAQAKRELLPWVVEFQHLGRSYGWFPVDDGAFASRAGAVDYAAGLCRRLGADRWKIRIRLKS